MRKYLQVFIIGLKEMLTYRLDVFGKGLSCFFKICIAYFMWNIIYSMNDTVSGYTFNQMISYYILINFLLGFEKSAEVSGMMAHEIRTGNFTKYVVKPLGAFGYYFSLIISKMTFSILINIISMAVWLMVFHSFFEFEISVGVFMNGMLIFILGMFFVALLNYFFTMITFWVVDSSAFFLIKDHLMNFVTGALVPLNLLPEGIISLFKYTPFYYIFYYPVNMCISGDMSQLNLAFLVLAIWCVLFLIIDLFIYRYAIRSYEGVGI